MRSERPLASKFAWKSFRQKYHFGPVNQPHLNIFKLAENSNDQISSILNVSYQIDQNFFFVYQISSLPPKNNIYFFFCGKKRINWPKIYNINQNHQFRKSGPNNTLQPLKSACFPMPAPIYCLSSTMTTSSD